MQSNHGFKNFIHRSDLMPVIEQGIIISFFGGLLMGAIELLLSYVLNMSFQWLLLFLIAYALQHRFKKTMYSGHIGFQILVVLFLWVSFYIMNVTSLFGLFFVNGVSDFTIFLRFLNPILYFSFLNPLRSSFFNLMNAIEVIFFIAATFYAYRSVK
jgi:hypothetical protein